MRKFSGDGIIGARKHNSLSSMVIFTLRYLQGHYYFLSVFSSFIQNLRKNLWATSVALNSCMTMKINSLGSSCLYNKSKDIISNLDHVISLYRWISSEICCIPKPLISRTMSVRNKNKTKKSIELNLEESVTLS